MASFIKGGIQLETISVLPASDDPSKNVIVLDTNNRLQIINNAGAIVSTPSITADLVVKSNISGGNNFVGNQNFGAGYISNYSNVITTAPGSGYTLLISDNGTVVSITGSSVTLPATFSIGYSTTLVQNTTGNLQILGAAGAGIFNRQGHTKLAGQYAVGSVLVVSNSGSAAFWVFTGDTSA